MYSRGSAEADGPGRRQREMVAGGSASRRSMGDEDGDGQPVAAVWAPSRGGGAVGRAARIAFVAACLALLGLILGAPLGLLAGLLYARLAEIGTMYHQGHHQGDLLALVTFPPLGALLGGVVVPTLYLARLLRRWCGERSGESASTGWSFR